MGRSARTIMEETFRAMERRDRDAILSAFAEDGVLIDPHYPSPEMRGRDAIGAGLDWGLSVMRSFGFTTLNYFASEDGRAGAFEIDTNHVLNGGRKLSFAQVFVVETDGGKITRLRAYEPYGPNGVGGFFLGLERLKRRLSGKTAQPS